MKYHGILDDGRRCQSCCNRAQIFGARDVVSGWEGDCRECNARWYLGQVSGASRMYARKVAEQNWFIDLRQTMGGIHSTRRIYRFAGFDLQYLRIKESRKRELLIYRDTLTNVIDSDDDFFVSTTDMALRMRPLEVLSHTNYRQSFSVSLLDVVVRFIKKPPILLEGQTSDAAYANCTITRLQQDDYRLETSGWRKYQWQGREYIYNYTTKECFWKDRCAPWKAYRFRHAVWWLNGRRWFWEQHGSPERTQMRLLFNAVPVFR